MGTVKYTGPVASFHCPTNAEIRSLKVHFSPKQEGSGDPSPENVREIVGWDGVEAYQANRNLFNNKADIGTQDNSVTPRTAPIYKYILGGWMLNISYYNPSAITSFRTTDTGFAFTSSDLRYGVYYIIPVPSNVYVRIDFDAIIPIRVSQLDENMEYITMQGNSGYSFQVLPNAKYLKFNFAGKVANEEIIFSNVRINMSTTNNLSSALPYEPYQGSTTNYEFGVLGKNKFDYANANIIDAKRRDDNGNEVADGTGSYSSALTPVSPSTTYTASGFGANLSKRIYYIDADENFLSRSDVISNNTFTFTTPSNCRYIQFQSGRVDSSTWSEVQLELGSTATTYEPYDPKHTVYGGWVDLISGEVCETHYGEALSECNSEVLNDQYNTAQTTFFRCQHTYEHEHGGAYNVRDLMCETLKPVSSNWGNGDTQDEKVNTITERYGSYNAVCMRMYNSDLGIDAEDDRIVRKEKVNAYLAQHPLFICYKLRVPNTYSLAPTQLQTFLGQNNVWSNADYVEVEYDLHETQTILARKQFIVANQPHVVKPAAAPLQSFTTDMAAPLKECKVHFGPVQEGTGDPSPENIRPISGWTGCEAYRSGENMWGGEALKAVLIDKMPTTSVNGNVVSYSNSNAGQHDGDVLFDCFKENTQYTLVLTYSKNTNTYCHMRFLYSDGSFDNMRILNLSPDTKRTGVFVSKAGKTLSKIVRAADEYSVVTMYCDECGLFEGVLTASDYESYTGTTLPVDWTTEAGTVYGGYVDLVSGEVWETYHHIAITAADITKRRAYGQHENSQTTQVSWFTQNAFNAPNPTPYVASSTDGFCSHLPFIVNNYAFYPKCQANNTTVDLRIDGLLTIEEFTAWLEANEPIDVVYPVATPFVVAVLTPTQLKTLRGTNNIWSNANGNIELSYWKH